MEQGIYMVNFRSPNTHDFGDGIVVADQGKINGGDKFCVYHGTYGSTETTTEVEVHVTIHAPGGITIFGPGIRDFHLKLGGTISGGNLNFAGHVVGQPNMKISLHGRKLADLK